MSVQVLAQHIVVQQVMPCVQHATSVLVQAQHIAVQQLLLVPRGMVVLLHIIGAMGPVLAQHQHRIRHAYPVTIRAAPHNPTVTLPARDVMGKCS